MPLTNHSPMNREKKKMYRDEIHMQIYTHLFLIQIMHTCINMIHS